MLNLTLVKFEKYFNFLYKKFVSKVVNSFSPIKIIGHRIAFFKMVGCHIFSYAINALKSKVKFFQDKKIVPGIRMAFLIPTKLSSFGLFLSKIAFLRPAIDGHNVFIPNEHFPTVVFPTLQLSPPIQYKCKVSLPVYIDMQLSWPTCFPLT